MIVSMVAAAACTIAPMCGGVWAAPAQTAAAAPESLLPGAPTALDLSHKALPAVVSAETVTTPTLLTDPNTITAVDAGLSLSDPAQVISEQKQPAAEQHVGAATNFPNIDVHIDRHDDYWNPGKRSGEACDSTRDCKRGLQCAKVEELMGPRVCCPKGSVHDHCASRQCKGSQTYRDSDNMINIKTGKCSGKELLPRGSTCSEHSECANNVCAERPAYGTGKYCCPSGKMERPDFLSPMECTASDWALY